MCVWEIRHARRVAVNDDLSFGSPPMHRAIHRLVHKHLGIWSLATEGRLFHVNRSDSTLVSPLMSMRRSSHVAEVRGLLHGVRQDDSLRERCR